MCIRDSIKHPNHSTVSPSISLRLRGLAQARRARSGDVYKRQHQTSKSQHCLAQHLAQAEGSRSGETCSLRRASDVYKRQILNNSASCFNIYGAFVVLWCLCRGLPMVAPVKFSWFEATLNVHEMCIRDRIGSSLPVLLHGCDVRGCSFLRRSSTWLMGADGRGSRGQQGNGDPAA
ncbi:hypothetical protein DEO72_LG10g1537 [Vigna unguiculata]|uniref:Uncharacterized protein n=1 Tax=Vigna unguiculata TaxID=3917 RepID=A0A4D6NCP6_VIGUN|nr:hypothetical protein DEO72_LG10g1537 [Vigna unguiculata]